MFITLNGKRYNISEQTQLDDLVVDLQKMPRLLHLKLVCENYNTELMQGFVNQVTESNIPVEARFNLFTLNPRTNQLQQIYEFDRYIFAKQMAKKIQKVRLDLVSDSNRLENTADISQHKINRVKKVAPHIIQQQQKIVSFVSTESDTDSEIESVDAPAAARRTSKVLNSIQRYTESVSNTFITAENITNYRAQLASKSGVSLTDQKLRELWNKLVPISANDVVDKSQVIANIEIDVLALFIKHANKFDSGVLVDNLPVVTDRYGNIQKHVAFEVLPGSYEHILVLRDGLNSRDIDEFTLLLGEEQPIKPNREAYLHKFSEKSTSPTFLNKLNDIFPSDGSTITADANKLKSNLKDFVGNQDSRLLTKALGKLNNLKDNVVFLRNCFDVLVSSDTNGLLVLLNQLAKVDYQLIEPFLNEPSNLIYLSSEQGIDQLIELANFSEAKKNWWNWLVAKHSASGCKLDFAELFATFQYFNKKLKDSGVDDLPVTVPFTDEGIPTCNIQVMLDAVKEIVALGQRNAQIYELSALNNGLMPAYQALKQRQLRLVTEGMQIQASSFGRLNSVTDPNNFQTIMQNAIASENEYKLRKSLFLQFIARKQEQGSRFNYAPFSAMCDTVSNLNEKLTPLQHGPKIYLNKETLPAGEIFGFTCKINGKRVVSLKFHCPGQAEPVEITGNKRAQILELYKESNGDFTDKKAASWEDLNTIDQRDVCKFYDDNPELFASLDYPTKSALLYIVAVTSSNQNSLKQISDPNLDLQKLLLELQGFAEKFAIPVKDILLNIHENGLNIEKCPSLAQLKVAFEVLREGFPASGDGNACIQYICDILLNHGDCAVDIFENLAAVAKKQQSSGGSANLLISLRNFSQLTAGLTRCGPEVYKSLALLAVEDNNYRQLQNSVNRMLESKRNELFTKLATIDLAAPGDMLTKADLLAITSKVNSSTGDGNALHVLQEHVDTNNIDLKYRVGNQAKSSISLMVAIRTLISEYNKYKADYIGKLKPFLPTVVRHGLEDVDVFTDEITELLKNSAPDEAQILSLFNKADLRLTYLKGDLNNESALSAIKSGVLFCFGEGEKRDQIEAYFNTFSLSAFMDEAIRTCVKADVDEIIQKIFPEIVISEQDRKSYSKQQLAENEKRYAYLWKFMKYGTKPAIFGLRAIDFDPTAESNQERLCDSLCLGDGIVKYNDNLYYVQKDSFSKTAIVNKITAADDEQKSVITSLAAKIGSDYQVVGLDGYRLLKITAALDSKKGLLQALTIKVRLLSPKQDAIIQYQGKYYRFDNIKQKCFELSSEQGNWLKDLFTSSSLDNKEVSNHDDRSLIKEVLGDDLYHTEYDLITKLGIKPIIFSSETVGLYNLKLDVFSEFLNYLYFIKESSSSDFKAYKEIFLLLSNEVEDVNDLIYTLNYLNTLYADKDPADRLALWRDLLSKINAHKNNGGTINLRSLRNSLEELSKSELRENSAFVAEIIKNMLGFCLKGSVFPIAVFNENRDKSPQELQEILNVATAAPEGIDVFAELNKLKYFFAGRYGSDSIQTALLIGLVADKENAGLFPEICTDIQTLVAEFRDIDACIGIFKALNGWPKFADANSKDDKKTPPFTLTEIKDLLYGLRKNKSRFTEIYNAVFAARPYPNLRNFVIVLNNSSPEDDANLGEELTKIDRYPFDNKESAEKFSFNNERVLAIINGIVSLPGHEPLSFAAKQKLIKDFSYVDVLSRGNSQFLPTDENGDPICLSSGRVKMFLHEDAASTNSADVLSTIELQELSTKLKEALQRAEAAKTAGEHLFHPDNRKLVLQYIAVMREIYYRKTGKIPNPAQIITIINALDNTKQQQVEIETAEGKSVTTALYSALLCAKRSTVLVPTSSAMLVNQDFYGKYNDLFFQAMGFTADTIDAHTDSSKIKLGSIYYGTARDINSLIAERRIRGLSLHKDIETGAAYSLAMVQDETDNKLDDLAECNLALQLKEDKNAISKTWVITAINEFVDSPGYLQIETVGNSEPTNAEDDLKKLKLFLSEKARKHPQDKVEAAEQLKEYSDSILQEFLQTANDMAAVAIESQYQILEKDAEGNDLEYFEATPVNDMSGAPERGNTFPRYSQAFLHDRLNRDELRGARFKVAMAPLDIDSQSSNSINQGFDYFVGLSATLGSKKEVLEVGKTATKIPPFILRNRKQLTPVAVKSQQEKDRAILDAIRFNGYESDYCPRFVLDLFVRAIELYKYVLGVLYNLFSKDAPKENLQPILLFTKDAAEAMRLQEEIAGKVNSAYEIQIITGKESDEEFQEMVNKAGRSNVITIGPPVLGRGIDYDSTHPDGLFVIKAFNSTLRGKIQVLGRGGRKQGTKSKFLDIVECEFSYDSILSQIFGLTRYQKDQQIAKQEERLNAEIAVKRYYIQEVDAYMQVILTHFDSIRHTLVSDHNADDLKLLNMRHLLLDDMKKKWQEILSDTDKNNNYGTNKYVRWKNDILGTESLERALSTFKSNLCTLWDDFKENRINPYKDDLMPPVASSQQHRPKAPQTQNTLNILLDEDIRSGFDYRALSQRAAVMHAERSIQIPQEYIKASLENFLDGSAATMEYDPENFARQGGEYKAKYVKNAIIKILSRYPLLNLTYSEVLSVSENFQLLLERIKKLSDNGVSKIKLYPIVVDCLAVKEIPIHKDWLVNVKEILLEVGDSITIDKSLQEIKNNFGKELLKVYKNLRYFGIQTNELQEVYENLKEANNDEDMLILYKELNKYICVLKNDTSFFPFARNIFGSNNLANLLESTLADIEAIYALTCSEKNPEELDTLQKFSEIGECEGYFELYLPKSEIARITSKVPDLQKSDWTELMNKFAQIQTEQKGFAVVEELLPLCRKYIEDHSAREHASHVSAVQAFTSVSHTGLHVKDSDVIPEKILYARLQKIHAKILQNNHDLSFTQQQSYLLNKQENLRRNIYAYCYRESIRGLTDALDVQICYGRSGASDIYELRINSEKNLKVLAEKLGCKRLGVTDEYDAKINEEQRKDYSVSVTVPEISDRPKKHNSSIFGLGMGWLYGSANNSSEDEVSSHSSSSTESSPSEIRAHNIRLLEERRDYYSPMANTIVKKFSNIEGLLEFENTLRASSDLLHSAKQPNAIIGC